MDHAARLPGVTRRALLAMAAAALARPARALTNPLNPRLSIAEPPQFTMQPADRIQHRFDIYRQIGIGTLRVAAEWWDQEPAEGAWRGPSRERYMRQAMLNGFRFKLQLATISTPPGWFLDRHPDGQMRNHDGTASRSDISYWYPGLRDVLADKAERLFASLAERGLLGAVDAVFVDGGPACEPIYPANWTMGPGFDPARGSFWFYDAHAQADFAPRMRAAYDGDLARANRAWGTRFASWGEVRVPELRTRPGPMWNDVLTWYRGAKREFVAWQIGNYQAALRHHAGARVPQLVLMVPGSHIQPGAWQQAVRDGAGDYSLREMEDSEFLIDVARRSGCWLQYTGVENAAEVAYLRSYMDATGGQFPMWGENAGSPEIGADPQRIAEVINRNGLYGFEYVGAQFVFDDEGVTPNRILPQLAKAFASVAGRQP